MADQSTGAGSTGAIGSAVGSVTGAVSGIVNKASGWVDQAFSIFGVYTASYSKYIVYGFLILALSKIFKFKFDFKTGGGKH